jgi:hypothetical protein
MADDPDTEHAGPDLFSDEDEGPSADELEDREREAERQQLKALNRLGSEWIAAGFKVFPCWIYPDPADPTTNKKAPAARHGHLEATDDPQAFYKMVAERYRPTKNPPPDEAELGLGGLPGASGYIVLDCDVKHGGTGRQVINELRQQHGDFATAAWRTPSGGIHVLLRKPAGEKYGNTSPWPGAIDIRADHGWIVLPGTRTSFGNYEWTKGNPSTVSDLPLAMAMLLSKPNPSPQYTRQATSQQVREFLEASAQLPPNMNAQQDFGIQLDRLDRAQRGSRRNTLFAVEGRMFGMFFLPDFELGLEKITEIWVRIAPDEPVSEVMDIATWIIGQELTKPERQVPNFGFGVAKTNGSSPNAPRAAGTPEIHEYHLANLPDDFWQRPLLASIRTWAHSRMRSADAVYGAIRARQAALTPHTLVIDTGIATPISLNGLLAIVGLPGAGKTTAIALARQALPIARKDVYEGPLGSGEGIVELYFETQQVPNPNQPGKTIPAKVQVKFGALLYLDEGAALARMASRNGTVLMETLRSCYSGELLGQTNASQDTRRVMPAGHYRFILLMGLQVTTAHILLADDTTGTAQRIVMFSANDASIPEQAPAAPPPTIPTVPPTVTGVPQVVTLAATVAAEVRANALAVQQGVSNINQLDAHRDQNRLKESAMLAILDGRTDINEDDWRLGGMILDTSDRLRSSILAQVKAVALQEAASKSAAAIKHNVTSQLAIDDAKHDQARDRGVKRIRDLVAPAANTADFNRTALNHTVAGRDKKIASLDEMIRQCVQLGYLQPNSTGGWRKGSSA